MADYGLSIHTNPDARAWAIFFCESAFAQQHGISDIDTMQTWFANAMMAMHDHMRPDLAPVVLPDGSAICAVEIDTQTSG